VVLPAPGVSDMARVWPGSMRKETSRRNPVVFARLWDGAVTEHTLRNSISPRGCSRRWRRAAPKR